ncbi:MAG TPA: hypothetical protein DDW50_00875 [Firmicutes bacterium]|nr:hypothetical protein [Bacillota bacterium]
MLLILGSVFLFNMQVMADGEPIKRPAEMLSLSQALRKIEGKFGVTIIADPGLEGLVPAEISGETVEETLKSILDPLGYYYTKFEKYYLISGPQSPLTLFAATDSCLVPVGFFDPKIQAQLGEYQRYLTYDPNLRIAYVKAPTSLLNKILAKLWQISRATAGLGVVYNLEIIDISQNSDLNFLFSGIYDNSQNGSNQVIITPNQWVLNGKIRALIENTIISSSDKVIRRPWLIALPGKTAQFMTNEHRVGETPDLDYNFTLRVTPVQVDADSGKVLSEIYIGRGFTLDDSLGTAKQEGISTTNASPETTQPMSMVSTTIATSPGQSQILAVVRQTNDAHQQWPLEKVKINQQRYYAVLLTVTPVNIQTTLAATTGLVPMASLGDFGLEEEEPLEIFPKSYWEMGLGTENMWLELNLALSSYTGLEMEYRRTDFYGIRLSQRLDTVTGHQTFLEFWVGEGVGPEKKAAAMVGFGDQTQPFGPLICYAQYYPWAYLLKSEDFSDKGVWITGIRLGVGKTDTILEVSGNPTFDGWGLQFDLNYPKYRWVWRYDDSTGEKVTLGIGLYFAF